MFYDRTRSDEVRALTARLDDPALNEALTDPLLVSDDGCLSIAVDVRIQAALLNRIETLERQLREHTHSG